MFTKSLRKLSTVSSLIFCVALLAAPMPQSNVNAQTPPDNTKKNKEQNSPNADQQKMNPADTALVQQIRKSVIADKTLSTYAHNIKIIAQDGKVTLRGPVRSEDEKTNLMAKAVAVAGQDNVTNQLEVAPPK